MKMKGRHLLMKYSTIRRVEHRYAPYVPRAFENVPIRISIRPERRKWSAEPRPCGGSTPVAWASSTTRIAPCRSLTSTMSGRGAMSPSMLKTPSVTTIFRRDEEALRRSSR